MKWQKPPGEDAEEINQQVEKIAKQATSKYSRTFFRISALFAKFFQVCSNICYTSIICNTLHPYQCSQCYLVFFIKKTCVTLVISVETVFATIRGNFFTILVTFSLIQRNHIFQEKPVVHTIKADINNEFFLKTILHIFSF